MAKLTHDDESIEIPDNSPCKEAAEQLGVPFGCTTGICGTCLVEVEEGMENLTPRTQEEEDMMLEPHERLLCQCRINEGEVKFKF